ncbi:LPXTG cell wall anchor domain-containing protein [Enterococcus pseudoavium]|uniref:LPXTG cell wall anchor domain-containing protein n=1 Tax=Enterococcus pseudoavium TaxID=44007 RepID=A0ABU3FJ27_9ENTE|nr:LPXTG cell wall anchor domain-containing protein [Enterococcus pseudoavium]MDT2771068.1 LPXTG cell wall anchor domain-containing protein [Enterococcus pseudoavium]
MIHIKNGTKSGIARGTILAALFGGLILFPTVSLADGLTSESTSVIVEKTNEVELVRRQGEISEELKAAHEQFEARQKQIAQDLADARQRRKVRQEDLHADFENWQNQLDQDHSKVQQHIAETNGRLEEDRLAIEDTWSRAQEQLDQARADFNKKVADAEKLQEQLKADQAEIEQSVSQVKTSGQAIQQKFVAGSGSLETTGDEKGNQTDEVAGTVNRVKAVIDSAGDDLAAEKSTVNQTQNTNSTIKVDDETLDKNTQPAQGITAFPKTNDQSNRLLFFSGLALVSGLVVYFVRKYHH